MSREHSQDQTEELSQVQPPGEEQPLDCEILEDLALKAVVRSLADLAGLEIPRQIRVVYHEVENGLAGDYTALPFYRHNVVWDRISEIWRSEEFLHLADYVYQRGGIKSKFVGPVRREVWERHAYGVLIHEPLINLLHNTAFENFIEKGVVNPWQVESTKLESMVASVASMHCGRPQVLRAVCPISGVAIAPRTRFETGTLKVASWPLRDRLVFVSRHGNEFSWDDFKSPLFVETIAEIGIVSNTPQSIVAERLDVLKWALFVAFGNQKPFAEGTCIIEDPFGRIVEKFKRDNRMLSGGGDYALDDEKVGQCLDIIREAEDASARWQNDDIRQAFWHFGRACVAPLPT